MESNPDFISLVESTTPGWVMVCLHQYVAEDDLGYYPAKCLHMRQGEAVPYAKRWAAREGIEFRE